MDEFIIVVDYGTRNPFPVTEVFDDIANVVGYIDKHLARRSYRVFKLTQSGVVARSEDGIDHLRARLALRASRR